MIATYFMPDTTSHPRLLLFDGVCNLCNGAIQFVLRFECTHDLRFAALQSETGQRELLRFGLSSDKLESLVLIEHSHVYTYSDAALRVAIGMGGWWRLAAAGYIVPKFLRDSVYKLVARYRYRVFGTTEACWLPRPEWSARFV